MQRVWTGRVCAVGVVAAAVVIWQRSFMNASSDASSVWQIHFPFHDAFLHYVFISIIQVLVQGDIWNRMVYTLKDALHIQCWTEREQVMWLPPSLTPPWLHSSHPWWPRLFLGGCSVACVESYCHPIASTGRAWRVKPTTTRRCTSTTLRVTPRGSTSAPSYFLPTVG